MNKLISLMAVLAVSVLSVTAANAASKDTVKIAWSHYTGWEPIGFMQSSGILAKHAAKNGVKVEMVFVGDYVDSITLYAAKQFNGVAVTNMDVLAIAGVGGRKSTALVVGDYSDGNDGLVFKGVRSLEDAANGKVHLVEYSVSHYLLARAYEKAGLSMDKMTLVNTTDADIPAIVKSAKSAVAVSWNPMLMEIRNMEGTNVVFTSREIPGEIIDMIVVGDEVSAAARRAIVDAWYEVMGLIKARDADTIKALAEQAGSSVADFEAQLETTHIFFTPAEAAAFVKNAQLKKTMRFVVDFSFKAGIYDGVDNADELGIRFPDGSVMGDAKNVMLHFDTTVTDAAAGR